MSKIISLTQGKETIVDDENYEELMKHHWSYHSGGYAKRGSLGKQIFMHRQIMNSPGSMDTDHINGNGLDNRKENLRICSRSENHFNVSKRADNTSGYKGVWWSEERQKWCAMIKAGSQRIALGRFGNLLDAVRAYDEAAIKYHGVFARTNIQETYHVPM